MSDRQNVIDVKTEIFISLYEKKHLHAELEIIYVLDGSALIEVAAEKHELVKNDILLINTNIQHSVQSGIGATVAKISLNFQQICRILGEEYIIFWCNSKYDKNYRYLELRDIINKLILCHIDENKNYKFKKLSLDCLLIDFLLQNFKVNIDSYVHRDMKDKKRLSFIMNYIQLHYMEKVNLTDIADKLFTSTSSLSRFFFKSTGQSFVDYIQNFRLQKVVEELIYTDEPITRIAIENGFSSPSVMNKIFQNSYQTTPSDYRSKFKTNTAANESVYITIKDKNIVKKLLNPTEETDDTNGDEVDRITIPTREPHHYQFASCSNKVLNIGSASYLYLSDMQEQIKFIKKELDIEYLRIWNIFSTKFMFKNNSTAGKFNFDNIDRILDFCVKNNLFLFIDLGARQEKSMTGKSSSLYKNNNTISFDTKIEFEDFLAQFLKHVVKRFGGSIISRWIFEISHHFDGLNYYNDIKYDPIQYWEDTSDIIKNIIPQAKIAGPGFKVSADKLKFEEEIKKLLSQKNTPDIFTMMVFPYIDHDEGDEIYTTRLINSDFLQHEVNETKNILKNNGFDKQFWITEWSDSVSNRNYIQDSCHKATTTLKTTLMAQLNVDALGFWYASDLINVYYDSRDILNGGSGLLTKNGICKPSFYALKFLSKLGRYLIKQTDSCMITTDDYRSYKVVCFNNIEYGPNYFLKEENSYKPTELNSLFENNNNKTISLCFTELKNNVLYLIHHDIINEHNGSVLNKWIELNCDSELTLEETSYLRDTCVPKVIKEKIITNDSKLIIKLNLDPHEIRFITITPDD